MDGIKEKKFKNIPFFDKKKRQCILWICCIAFISHCYLKRIFSSSFLRHFLVLLLVKLLKRDSLIPQNVICHVLWIPKMEKLVCVCALYALWTRHLTFFAGNILVFVRAPQYYSSSPFVRHILFISLNSTIYGDGYAKRVSLIHW